VSVVKDITESLKREEQEFELRLARVVQQRLYPAGSPRVEGFDIAGATFPAAAMCGDYFDYIPMSQGHLGIVIGDVCGHGLGPSLLMAETRAYLRSYCRTHRNIGEILDLLNATLADDTEDNSFVTLIFGCLDPAERSFTYVNAGHPPGFILDESGEVKKMLRSTDVPAGLFSNHEFDLGQTVALEPGDLVLFLTDGITESEAPDGTPFGTRGALEAVRAVRHESSEQIVRKLCQSAIDFAQGQPQNDDITAVVLKVDRPA
jgi:sigma-B regulation protein RsbU (phosphoserine phosphatase)